MGAKLEVGNDIFHVHGICKMGKKNPAEAGKMISLGRK